MLTDIPIAQPISYLTLYNAHNGESVKIPKPIRFHSLIGFKSFIYESFTDHIIASTDNIFLLTSFGMKIKFNMINELNEVYVFDKRMFTGTVENILLEAYVKQNEGGYKAMMKPTPSLLGPLDKLNIKQLSSSLKTNEAWSKAILRDCHSIVDHMKAFVRQINTIFKCLNIIFQFGSNFVHEIEKSFNTYMNYIKLLNLKTLHRSWNGYYNNLRKFPSFKFKNGTDSVKLIDHINVHELENSASIISHNLPVVIKRFNEMSASINAVNNEQGATDTLIETLRNESIVNFKDYESGSEEIVKEISELSQLISNDIDKLSTSTSISLDWVYRVHKDEISPKIFDKATELYKIFQNLYAFKNKIVNESLGVFEKVANLQMRMVSIKNDLKGLANDNNEESNPLKENEISGEVINKIKSAEDYLSLTIDLPLIFGFMLIEKRRQFEWHEFYSKGIVNSVSEQLSVLIDHEKVFRKMWMKKFGNFLSLLNNTNEWDAMRTVIPSIDVTLVNGNFENNMMYGAFGNVQIDRQDITTYIDALEEYSKKETTSSQSSKKFVDLIRKNFQDLIQSTNNMRKATKVVSSLSSFTSPIANEIKTNDKLLSNEKENGRLEIENSVNANDNDEIDNDINLVKGLRVRIKKLENLLHQHQYKDISNWPVTRAYGATNSLSTGANGKVSLIIDPDQKSPMTSDPTSLLQRRQTLPSKLERESSSKTQVNQSNHLDVPTTIDKHLDNIRLRKENKALSDENIKLMDINKNNEDLIAKLNERISNIESRNKEEKKMHDVELHKKDEERQEALAKLEKGFNDSQPKIIELQKELELRHTELSMVKEDSSKLSIENKRYEEEIIKLNKKISDLENDIIDVNNMKKDLLSNMVSKETDSTNHRISLEEEIKKLRSKVEETTDDYENLMELTQSKDKSLEIMVNYLSTIIMRLILSIKSLAKQHFENFVEFCFILESMGLLLIKEYNNETGKDEFKITRVKGLRSKKNDKVTLASANGNLLDETPIVSTVGNKPTTKVFDDICDTTKWITDINLFEDKYSNSAEEGSERPSSADTCKSTNIEDIPEELLNIPIKEANQFNRLSLEVVKLYSNIFKADEGCISKFENFVNTISFEEKHFVQNQNHDDINSDKFFLNAITKRFRDVEGFAKKLTKENKGKSQEISHLEDRLNNKISMNNFQVNDLVLFLPTRIDRSDQNEDNFQPWAAFNIGAPHYFLREQTENGNTEKTPRSMKDKEWMVGRVTKLEVHTVTDDNFNDKDANPYHLSTGVVWYVVDASEENF